jgi:hypothetical protein
MTAEGEKVLDTKVPRHWTNRDQDHVTSELACSVAPSIHVSRYDNTTTIPDPPTSMSKIRYFVALNVTEGQQLQALILLA